MGASSVTGVGQGAADKPTAGQLAALANGPTILITGITESVEEIASSPPAVGGTVIFPTPLPGLGEEHVVVLTTLNGGWSYVTDMDDHDLDGDDADDHFTGFSFLTEFECDVMYIVSKIGIKPTI